METRDYENDCESIFREDVIEKKITGRGAFGKTSCTRKRNGGMPSDFLKGRKLKEYMGNSEVKTYNLYDIKPKKHKGAPRKFTQEIENQICAVYQTGEKPILVSKRYGISCQTLYKILKRNGVAKLSDKPETIIISTTVNPDELYMDRETETVACKEPEHLAEEVAIDYKSELDRIRKKCELLKEENEKYRVALLNLATRMI